MATNKAPRKTKEKFCYRKPPKFSAERRKIRVILGLESQKSLSGVIKFFIDHCVPLDRVKLVNDCGEVDVRSGDIHKGPSWGGLLAIASREETDEEFAKRENKHKIEMQEYDAWRERWASTIAEHEEKSARRAQLKKQIEGLQKELKALSPPPTPDLIRSKRTKYTKELFTF